MHLPCVPLEPTVQASVVQNVRLPGLHATTRRDICVGSCFAVGSFASAPPAACKQVSP
jgi:hypothetical protein